MNVEQVPMFACNFRSLRLIQRNRINITGCNSTRCGQKRPVERLGFQQLPFDMRPTPNLVRPVGILACESEPFEGDKGKRRRVSKETTN
jgi:hypothetical protein